LAKFEDVKKEMLKKEDKLGQKIEPGIIDLVTALNCHGLITDSSCEGHLDKGEFFFPWVCVSNKISKEYRKDKIKLIEFNLKNLELQRNIILLLEEFYQNRNTPYQHRLIAGVIPGLGTEIYPQSGFILGLGVLIGKFLLV
tara:strand:- start:114 stop:536 length:423 start_codon:yes stop_codon:yes gene_type:complete